MFSSSSSVAAHRSKAYLRESGAVRLSKSRQYRSWSPILVCQNSGLLFVNRPDREGWNGAADILRATTSVDAGRDCRADQGASGRSRPFGPAGPRVASLDEAGPTHLAFFDNLKYADQLAATKAGACLVSPRFEASVPSHVAVLQGRTAVPGFCAIGARTASAMRCGRSHGLAATGFLPRPSSIRRRVLRTG